MDVAGAIAQLFAYDACGQAIGFNPADALTEFLYSGEQFDAKIGQQYLRQRYYDPSTGRFNRLDPFFGNLSDPQSFHKYLYTHADPVNGIDPSGMMSVGMACSIGIGISLSTVSAGVFIGHVLGGSSWYHAGMQALSPFAVPLSIGASIISLPFGVLTSVFDYRALYNKWSCTGKGGKDATDSLQKLRENVINTWSHLSPDQKLDTITKLYGYGLVNWDVTQLVENKNQWTSGVANPAEDTLTYGGRVYAVAEVNYVLWGLVNRLAYEDGIMPWLTNRTHSSSLVFTYRNAFGWIINLDQLNEGNLNDFETTGGKMLWADYGWNWAMDIHTTIPTGTSIHYATPNTMPFTGTLSYNFGGVSGPN